MNWTQFRVREGAAIDAELAGARSLRSMKLSARWKRSGPARCPISRSGCSDRLAELLNGAQMDPARLAQEAALIAERSDISEELVRLKTHADQTGVLISADGETGKKLDFLLQEMNREPTRSFRKPAGWAIRGWL